MKSLFSSSAPKSSEPKSEHSVHAILDKEGRTPIFFAKNQHDVNVLLARGADINARDHRGQTCLFAHHNPEFAAFLIGKGANPNIVNNNGDTALLWLIDNRHNPHLVETLIEHGTDVTIKNKDMMTALHRCKDPHIARLLISRGADVGAFALNNITPLHYIIRTTSTDLPELIEVLIDAGADPKISNSFGETCLHRYFYEISDRSTYGPLSKLSFDVLSILLKNGANPGAISKDCGNTPLHEFQSGIAPLPDLIPSLVLMLQHGADFDALNDDGVKACAGLSASVAEEARAIFSKQVITKALEEQGSGAIGAGCGRANKPSKI